MITKTVYKYFIPVEDSFTLDLPETAKILKFAEQKGELFIWCEVYTIQSLLRRNFRLFGTGHEMPFKPLIYIDTVFTSKGFVWHLYEDDDK